MGAPGWPELACCTASMARVRIVLMDSVFSCFPVTNVCSLATMRVGSSRRTVRRCRMAPAGPGYDCLEFRAGRKVQYERSVSISAEARVGRDCENQLMRDSGMRLLSAGDCYFSIWR